MTKDEWAVGDRVFVPRITKDPTVILKILDFEDEDEDDCIVKLLEQEVRNVDGSAVQTKLQRQKIRFCRFSELQDTPRIIVRGGPIAREMRQLPPTACGCGCGQLTSGAEFKQGHDMKLKSRLLQEYRGTDDQLSADALEELKRRGWWKHG